MQGNSQFIIIDQQVSICMTVEFVLQALRTHITHYLSEIINLKLVQKWAPYNIETTQLKNHS